MEGNGLKFNIKPWLDKMKGYRYPLLILLVGLMLLLLPGKGKKAEETASAQEHTLAEEQTRLASILEQIDGVGSASVLLSCSASEETEYLSDADGTVLLSAGSGTQAAVVRRTLRPVFQGAVVVCSGGGNAAVKLQVVEAVSKFTGLGAADISVFPRRSGN